MSSRAEAGKRSAAGRSRGTLCFHHLAYVLLNIILFSGGPGRNLDRLQPLGLLVLRVVLGIIMIAHGYTKLTPAGFHQHANFVGHLGMPWWFAFFSTAAENLGGALLILGLFTRFAALGICAELIVIIAKVHWKNGLL